MGEGISEGFKTEPDGGGRGTLSRVFSKEAIPREGTWSQHLPRDRTKVLRSLLGNRALLNAGELTSELGKGRDTEEVETS